MLKKIARTISALIISEALASEEGGGANSLYAQGIRLIRSGNLNEALVVFNRLVKMDIKNEKFRQIREGIEHKLSVPSGGTIPPNAEGMVEELYNEGNALMELDLFTDAAFCFEKALAIKPRNTVLWYRRGLALHRLGRHEEAVSCMDRALEVNPSFADALYLKGASLNKLKRPDEALECFDRIVAVEPDHVPFFD